MSAPGEVPIPRSPIEINSSFAAPTPSDSLWDRISTWASENKAVVYTIAGVTLVVTGAGVYYYLAADKPSQPSPTPGQKKKKSKRKTKKEDDASARASKASISQAPSVTSADIPDTEGLSEEVIESLSEQVSYPYRLKQI
jgi:import receptor subunit TOM70